MEKAIMEMRDKKATGDDDVPVEALELLGDNGLNLLTQLMNNIYESGEWPKDFTGVTMVTLKKKPKATKCTDHRTISLQPCISPALLVTSWPPDILEGYRFLSLLSLPLFRGLDVLIFLCPECHVTFPSSGT
jgi:hypothetical protein